MTADTVFRFIRGEVTDVDVEDDSATVLVDDEKRFPADRVVLALGNFPPRQPPIANRSALYSKRYIRNPWDPGVLDAIARDDSVFLIGTGQTSVDQAIALRRRGHDGRIIALSRRGLLPMAHGTFAESYDAFVDEIRDTGTIRGIFGSVRRHLERAAALQIDRRAVIDSLRPDTQALWAGLAEDEKRRFLRHVFRYWEIIRSRIPPESEAVIDAMRATGQLDIVAGRLRDLVDNGTAMDVHYVPRGSDDCIVEPAAWVLNCVGPESDYGRIEQPLVGNLLQRGLIRPGPARLGIDALPSGAIVGRDGVESEYLYTLGSTMKGVLWEVLAVPEIRLQAEQLAHRLVDDGRTDS
jgi:uncharacterized NAD(P)/FAD-binding protein YdhS